MSIRRVYDAQGVLSAWFVEEEEAEETPKKKKKKKKDKKAEAEAEEPKEEEEEVAVTEVGMFYKNKKWSFTAFVFWCWLLFSLQSTEKKKKKKKKKAKEEEDDDWVENVYILVFVILVLSFISNEGKTVSSACFLISKNRFNVKTSDFLFITDLNEYISSQTEFIS